MSVFFKMTGCLCWLALGIILAGCSAAPEQKASVQSRVIVVTANYVMEHTGGAGITASSSESGARYQSMAKCKAALTGIYIQFLKDRAFDLVEQSDGQLIVTDGKEVWRCQQG